MEKKEIKQAKKFLTKMKKLTTYEQSNYAKRITKAQFILLCNCEEDEFAEAISNTLVSARLMYKVSRLTRVGKNGS
jgi:hypothetical protein